MEFTPESEIIYSVVGCHYCGEEYVIIVNDLYTCDYCNSINNGNELLEADSSCDIL